MKKNSLITQMKQYKTFSKGITFVLSSFLIFSVFTTPAFADGVEKMKKNRAIFKANSSNRISLNLNKANKILDNMQKGLYSSTNKDSAYEKLDELYSSILNDEDIVLEQFSEEREKLVAKNVPKAIIKRHDNMVKHFKINQKKMLNKISHGDKKIQVEDVETSPITDVNPEQFKRQNQPKNPDFLPTNILKPNLKNKPKDSLADFTLSGLQSNPVQYYTALGDFTYSSLADADNEAYLGEDDAVVLTNEIKAKAEELEYNAVKIYHWVRNNVEWIPSWGSTQNAQLTLETLRGNSLDISTLTIALLRASKIPARYVHGRIKVASDDFKNWAGGFSDVTAAGNYASSAGVPIGYLQEAGKISHMALEHIWVEAATDYYPSRGARNLNADSWVSLDPSYKLYEYQEGIDAMAIAGIDSEALIQDILSSAEINETDGSISSMDTEVLQTVLLEAQSKLETHIDTNLTDPTALDVIGGKKTIIQEYPTLPSSMPNEFMVGTHYGSIPSELKRTMSITLHTPDNTNTVNKVFNFNAINNEKVTLSFKPATQDDEDTLASYLPDGNITDISQLPSELPAYLINVIPELKVNGEVVLSANVMRLGEELDITMQATIPDYGSVCPQTHRTIAGSYLSLNVISQSVSPKKLQNLQEKLENTKAILESSQQTQLASLSREDILGDMMYAGSLSYFAQLQAQSQIAGLSAKALSRVVAANGVFGYEPKVTYLYGMPRTISAGGIHLDIPMNSVTQSLDGDEEKTAQFVIQVGTTASALEHQVPEQMFNTDPANPVEAISAVKALQIANAEGQKIYQIDKDNIDIVLPKLSIDSDIINEIKDEVSRGKVMTTHTSNVSVPGWSGVGYIVVNPKTGDGGYYISGGENGGKMKPPLIAKMMFLLGIIEGLLEHPVASKYFDGLAALFGVIQNMIENLIDLLETCKSTIYAISVIVMLLMIDIIMEALLITLGVGIMFSYSVGYAIGWAQDKFINFIKTTAPCQ